MPRYAATILVVEDEKPILRMIVKSLAREKSYRVLTAASAEHGLDVGRFDRRTITLLISNVMLPGMSGSEIARRIKKVRPHMAVILIDGKGNGKLAVLAKNDGWRVLRKTQAGDALLACVRHEIGHLAVPAKKANAAGR